MSDNLVWGWINITYIFLGGLAAGAFFISALFVLSGKMNSSRFAAARYGALLAPVAAIIGGSLLPMELGHPFRAWRVYLNFAQGWESPMFYGAWLLLLFIITSSLYALTFLTTPRFLSSPAFSPLQPVWRLLPFMSDDDSDEGFGQDRKGVRNTLAWTGLIIGMFLALYYGVLHAGMPSRPFWNSPILPLLFLFSAYGTGVGGVILLRSLLHSKSSDPELEAQYRESGNRLLVWVLVLALSQLVLVAFFILFGAGFGTLSVARALSVILPGGPLALDFWLWVVFVGLILPVLIALVYMVPDSFKSIRFLSPGTAEVVLSVALLWGGFMLRHVVVIAGQITGPVGI